MQIRTPPTPAVSLRSLPGGADSWAPGTVVPVRVLRVPAPGQAWLQIGRHTVAARTELALEPGTFVRMQVVRTGPPLVLHPATEEHPRGAQRTTPPGALARVVAAQLPLARALAAVVHIAQRPGSGPSPAPPADRLLDLLLPVSRAADAQAVARAIAASGGPLAPGPARPGGVPALQAALETLARAMHRPGLPGRVPTPTRSASLQPEARSLSPMGPAAPADPQDVLQGLEAAWARVALHQVASARLSAEGTPQWLFELPVLHPDGLDTAVIHIRRERESGTAQDPRAHAHWRVDVTVPMGDDLVLHARVHLEGSNRIRATLCCPDDRLHERVQAQLDRLHGGLEAAGLRVAHLSCRQAPAPSPPEVAALLPRLLDERA